MRAKKVLCLFLSAMLVSTSFQVPKFVGRSIGFVETKKEQTVYGATNNGYGLADNIQDGVILHCFDWKYNDIKAELPNIAAAGFTSVQTSPAQKGVNSGIWYWLYQPLGFSVATNDLGTREELRALCAEADKYGIKVIVDVVANHLAGDHTNIQSDLKDSKYWHTYGSIDNYSNRTAVTTGNLGMQDIKSEDAYVQQLVRNYVLDLKSLGVDGIRWDAAKHIALPSENCNFWPAVCNDTGLYHYGEILGEPGAATTTANNTLMSEYVQYMSVTDSSYGQTFRNAFNSGTAPTSYGNWTTRGISGKKLVYWAESHDTWSNDKESGYSNEMSQNVIDRAYAMVASRQYATALYLSRPSSAIKTQIYAGVKGSTHFTSKEVAAVNHFHNAMIGQSEYFVSSNNVAAVCREKGVVIAMGSGSGNVSIPNGGSLVEPGIYTDEITGNTFTVTSSTITGTVGSTGIAVVYDWKEEIPTTTTTPAKTYTAYLNLPAGWNTPVYCYVYDKSSAVNNAGWPGVTMTYDSVTGYYKYQVPSNITEPRVIFYSSDTNRYPGDQQEGLAMTDSNMLYDNGVWKSFNPNEAVTTTAQPDDGYLTGTINDWKYSGKWGMYYGDWGEATSSVVYKVGTSPLYSLKVNSMSMNAEWLIQASYTDAVTSGHTYKVSFNITTNKNTDIGMKEEFSNGSDKPAYEHFNANEAKTITGTYKVTSDEIRIVFELGTGVSQGTIINFNNVTIEDVTVPEVETTTTATVENLPIEVFGEVISSDSDNTISVTWGQNTEQINNGQRYNIYLDGVLVYEKVECKNHLIENVPAGNHEVRITATLNGVETTGITKTVTVSGQESITTETTTVAQETTSEITTKEPETTPEITTTEPVTEPVTTEYVIEGGIEVNGYQISATAKGFRTVYSMESEIDGKPVTEAGLVYALSDYANDDELVLGNDNKFVKNFAKTEAGKISTHHSKSSSADSYAMTMQFSVGNMKEYTANMAVRAYAKLEDGTVVYTDVYHYSIYQIAEALYRDRSMSTKAGHDYLYEEILKVVVPDYKEIEYFNNDYVEA